MWWHYGRQTTQIVEKSIAGSYWILRRQRLMWSLWEVVTHYLWIATTNYKCKFIITVCGSRWNNDEPLLKSSLFFFTKKIVIMISMMNYILKQFRWIIESATRVHSLNDVVECGVMCVQQAVSHHVQGLIPNPNKYLENRYTYMPHVHDRHLSSKFWLEVLRFKILQWTSLKPVEIEFMNGPFSWLGLQ